MIAAVRRLVSAFAILATVLTAGAVGAVRGQAMATGEIVICSGGGAVTIAVDAGGNPAGPPHWCPDCVLLLLAGVLPAPAMAGARVQASVTAPAALPVLPGAVHARVPPARGPPAA